MAFVITVLSLTDARNYGGWGIGSFPDAWFNVFASATIFTDDGLMSDAPWHSLAGRIKLSLMRRGVSCFSAFAHVCLFSSHTAKKQADCDCCCIVFWTNLLIAPFGPLELS